MIGRITRWEVSKNIEDLGELSRTINQQDLANIHIIFDPKRAEYIFFLPGHGIYTEIDCILGYKTNINN